MKMRYLSRRSFMRILAGLFAFIPAARSLSAFTSSDDTAFQPLVSPRPDAPGVISGDELKELLRTRIAKGKALTLEGSSIWISDRYTDRLRLVITERSIVWKGKYNVGNDFASYPHAIEPGDTVIARGQRNGDEFMVERMYANILNAYINVGEIILDQGEVTISYTDLFPKTRPVTWLAKAGAVKVRPDYLVDQALYEEVVRKHLQLRGTMVQIIGLPLKDGTIAAANILI